MESDTTKENRFAPESVILPRVAQPNVCVMGKSRNLKKERDRNACTRIRVKNMESVVSAKMLNIRISVFYSE